MNILDQIILEKKEEVKEFKEVVSLGDIMKKIPNNKSSFLSVFENNTVGIIAEIKVKSPSEGNIIGNETINALELTKKLVKEYDDAGVNAISIVTDEKYFGGNLLMIQEASTITSTPIFQKDFIIDPIQIYNSKLLGASALLLIARILTQNELNEFVNLCFEIGLEPVVEIYNEKDLGKTLSTKVKFIGVNSRDLSNFKVDIDAACELIKKIPTEKFVIGFSGVKLRDDVEKYKAAGVKAVLIGTNLLRAENKKAFLESLNVGYKGT